MRRTRALGPLLATVLALPACANAPQRDAEVLLADYAVVTARTLGAGPVVLDVRNEGLIHHDLTICRGDLGACDADPVPIRVVRKPEQAREPELVPEVTESLVVGAEWDLTVATTLEPGRYRFYCAIINHAARGMETVVVVA